MKHMTFEEWCKANQDLVDDIRAEMHPAGVSIGYLADLHAENAALFLTNRLRTRYNEQLKHDAGKLAAWNAAVEA